MKRCTKCGIEKNESEFSPNNRHKDGLQSRCKLCRNDYYYNLRQRCFRLFNSKCNHCGETNMDLLSINHIRSPKSDVYKGLKRSGWTLYRQILDKSHLIKHFTLLCANCNMLDYYQKSGYYNEHTNPSTLWNRQKKEKICQIWNYKCFRCFKTFPIELLTINHVNGGGRKEKKDRNNGNQRSLFQTISTNELIGRIDSGELELTCFNCNCNRTESSKWIKQGKNTKESFK